MRKIKNSKIEFRLIIKEVIITLKYETYEEKNTP